MTSKGSILTSSNYVTVLKRFYLLLRSTSDWSGMFLISLQGIILYFAFGPGALSLLVVVAILVTLASILRHIDLLIGHTGAIEKVEPRNWRNAIANAGVATAFGTLSLAGHSPQLRSALLVAAVASLATALSDTLSHEIGILYGEKPRLITKWSRVEPGANGAVSLVGSAVGVAAAFGLPALGVVFGLITLQAAALAGVAACVGNVIDSFLGATLENKRWIGGNVVNFGAVFSSGVSVLVFMLYAISV